MLGPFLPIFWSWSDPIRGFQVHCIRFPGLCWTIWSMEPWFWWQLWDSGLVWAEFLVVAMLNGVIQRSSQRIPRIQEILRIRRMHQISGWCANQKRCIRYRCFLRFSGCIHPKLSFSPKMDLEHYELEFETSSWVILIVGWILLRLFLRCW